jgi:hypothetical protein
MARNRDLENSHPLSSHHLTSHLEIANWEIVVDGRFFGLNAGDWTVLITGFGLSTLAVLLLLPDIV